MVVHFSWKEKWTGVLLYTDSWAVANDLTGRSMIRKLLKKAFEQRIWKYLCPTKVPIKRWLQQEEVNNQIGYYLNCQFLSPAISSIGQLAMNKVVIMVEMEIMHGLTNMNFHLLRLPYLQLFLNVKSVDSRDEHWTLTMAPFLGVISSWPGSRSLHWTTSFLERAILCPYLKVILILVINLLFLHITLLPKLPSLGQQFCHFLAAIMILHETLLLSREPTSLLRKCGSRHMLRELTSFAISATILKQKILIEW